MRVVPCLAVLVAVASLACRPPEFNALSQSPPMVEVVVTVAAKADDAQDLEREFAAALRARLSSYATVVPDGVAPPKGAFRLSVEIDKMSRKKIDAAAVGAGAAVAMGAAHAVSRASGGYRGSSDFFAILDAILFGLNVASDIEARQQYRAVLLGYFPPRISGMVTLGHIDGGYKKPIFIEGIKSSRVIDALSPINGIGDPSAVDAELARALAKVVVGKLKDVFDWRTSAVPSWYEPPDATKPD